jgi:hypothetical protein
MTDLQYSPSHRAMIDYDEPAIVTETGPLERRRMLEYMRALKWCPFHRAWLPIQEFAVGGDFCETHENGAAHWMKERMIEKYPPVYPLQRSAPDANLQTAHA